MLPGVVGQRPSWHTRELHRRVTQGCCQGRLPSVSSRSKTHHREPRATRVEARQRRHCKRPCFRSSSPAASASFDHSRAFVPAQPRRTDGLRHFFGVGRGATALRATTRLTGWLIIIVAANHASLVIGSRSSTLRACGPYLFVKPTDRHHFVDSTRAEHVHQRPSAAYDSPGRVRPLPRS